MWGIEFRSPIFNAAGLFKNGEGYSLVAREGAGAYLAGTATANPRAGNEREGIRLAFSPYPRSGAASNWLGLPNDGDEVIAGRLSAIAKVRGCPVGISVMGSPDYEGSERLNRLIAGMHRYLAANADFLELNESCPNTVHGKPQDEALRSRLEAIRDGFLSRRPGERPFPVIVKFSNDTPLEQVPELLKLLLELGFDGVNFGNTSVDYARHRNSIHEGERRLYDFFSTTFGGGVSGRPVKKDSLALVQGAKEYLNLHPPGREFHIIRTGGIENGSDVRESLAAGASLVEWYTGYFELFSKHGYGTYQKLIEGYLSACSSAALPV